MAIDREAGEGAFELRSRTVGALPIVNAFLDRLGVDRCLAEAVTGDPRARLHPAVALGVLLRNIIEARTPLYALGEWMASRDPELVGLGEHDRVALNDDRVGRALDRLFDADRATLCSAIAVGAVRRFKIDTDELHNDSTSITFAGSYPDATGARLRGRPTAKITRGHNKDHRSDLKQLLWILTVTADGTVPIHYRVADGNTNDVEPHTGIWDTLADLVGHRDFLYVADSKLCTRENLDHIAGRGGRFLTVVPRSRTEDRDFRRWVASNTPDWVLARNNATLADGTPDAYLVCEAPWPSAEGHRVVWVLSTSKRLRDAQSRQTRIRRAGERLDQLADKLAGPKARIRTKAGADQAARAVLADTRTETYIDITLEEVTEATYRQERRGRPGANTRYRRSDHTRIELNWSVRDTQVRADAASDGMFPLITNDRDLTTGELLAHYKHQPCLERRHTQLKTGLEVVPMWLKDIGRIEAILLLHFIALLVRALIEREIRQRMNAEDVASLPLYPEDRDCHSPSAERILTMFATLQRHDLVANGVVVQTFQPELTSTHRHVLKLLGLPPSIYGATAN